MKEKLLTVTIKDFDMQTFTVSGHGGGGKDTSNNGVRLIHRASGVSAEGKQSRSLTKNREDAFRKIANSQKFRNWLKLEASKRMGKPSIEQIVDNLMQEQNIKTEVKDEKGRWIETNACCN